MLRPEVSIIIVNYNTAREIETCLISIQNSKGKSQNLEIIVVDNASTDNSVKVIKKFFQVKLIQNKENLGFAKANNIGAAAATGNFFFFLNPDCEIQKDTIQKLLEFAKKNPNSIIGPKLSNPDGSQQGSCYNLPTIWGAIKEFWLNVKGAYEKFAPTGDKPVKVQAIVGAAMLVSKNIFEKIGGFSEKYFLYYEDLDFCQRATKLGIPVYYHPQAIVTHSLGRAGGNLEHLKKSAKIYHGAAIYWLITLIIKIGQWLKF